MKYIILFLTLSLTACASTDEDIDNETVERNFGAFSLALAAS
tara:strand:+ start:1524 stop:1649 length:126 start_codon:yes stop_codon:yes gene_type:complete